MQGGGFWVGLLGLLLGACAQPEAAPAPPVATSAPPAASPQVAPPPPPATAAPAAPSPPAPPAAPAQPPPAPSPPATNPAAPGAPATASSDSGFSPPLLDADGKALPQTRERPSLDSPGFRQRLALLVEAIAQDDPARALPAFFPRVAYEQVKAIADPARDWQQRLVRAFERNIHDYHRELGNQAAGASLARVLIDERRVRWMDPGSEGNRVGYYRVTRSRLELRLASGATRELELTSLISWRGAWYVVHLHGFG